MREPIRPEQFRPARTRRGTPFGMTIQREGSDIALPLFGTTLVKAYRAQFFSAMREAVKAKVDWIGVADFNQGGMHTQADVAAEDLARRWNWDERDLAESVFPQRPRYLRNKVHESLNLDMARAVVLGLALAPDGIHAPLLAAKVEQSDEVESHPAGICALGLLLPDVREASWRDVASIRKDRGLRYFRDRLRELEAGASSEPLLEQAVRDALLIEVERKMPSWGSEAISATVNVVASPIPGLGTVATGLSAGMDIADTWRDRHRWTAALIRARRRLARS